MKNYMGFFLLQSKCFWCTGTLKQYKMSLVQWDPQKVIPEALSSRHRQQTNPEAERQTTGFHKQNFPKHKFTSTGIHNPQIPIFTSPNFCTIIIFHSTHNFPIDPIQGSAKDRKEKCLLGPTLRLFHQLSRGQLCEHSV